MKSLIPFENDFLSHLFTFVEQDLIKVLEGRISNLYASPTVIFLNFVRSNRKKIIFSREFTHEWITAVA